PESGAHGLPRDGYKPMAFADGCGLLDDPDTLLEHVHGNLRLLLCNDQRRRETDARLATSQEKHAAFERQIDDAVALRPRRSLELSVLHDLDRDHEPPPTDVANHAVLLGPALHALDHEVAHHVRVPHTLALDHVHRGQSSSEADGI